jgi:hypothetical protein
VWLREKLKASAKLENFAVQKTVASRKASPQIKEAAQGKTRAAGMGPRLSYATCLATSIGSKIEGSSFSGLLTRAEIGHIRMSSAGNGRIRSRGSGPSLSQRTQSRGARMTGMAYSPPPLSVMAAAPIGLEGLPPGITFGSKGSSRLTSSGGDHAGLSCFPLIMAVPVHCLPARPTPTG